MPLSLGQLAGNRATTAFEYAGGTVNLTFLPSMITDQTLAIFLSGDTLQGSESSAALASVQHMMHEVNATLCRVVTEWDLFEDDAMTVMIPLEPTRLETLPIAFRMRVITEIMKAANLGEANGTPSNGHSPNTSPSATPTGSSPLAVVSPASTN